MTSVEIEIELGETASYLLEEMLEEEVTDELLEEFVEQLIREKIIQYHGDVQGDLS